MHGLCQSGGALRTHVQAPVRIGRPVVQHKVRLPIAAEVRALPAVQVGGRRWAEERLALRCARAQAEVRVRKMQRVPVRVLCVWRLRPREDARAGAQAAHRRAQRRPAGRHPCERKRADSAFVRLTFFRRKMSDWGASPWV